VARGSLSIVENAGRSKNTQAYNCLLFYFCELAKRG
jgi:hypothetical protein